MINRVMLFVLFVVVLTLFVPAARVQEKTPNQFETNLANIRIQALALLGLPIQIPRRIRPTTTPIANNSVATTSGTKDDIYAADVVLALLEQADLVKIITMVPTPSQTITRTTVPTPSATATTVIQQPTLTPPTLDATIMPQVSTPIAIPEATVVPQTVLPEEPISPTAVVFLPNSILDGFRTRMPYKGFWWNTTDNIYVAIGSFKYQNTFYGNDAESYQKYVSFAITLRNEQSSNNAAIVIDPANMTLIDLDGFKTQVHRDYRNLNNSLLPNTISPGQSDAGQLVFVIRQYAAPAQLIVAYTYADQPGVVYTQTIEFRVWPTVN